MRPYTEVRLGRAHRADVIVGSICGALLFAAVMYDILPRIAAWLAG